MAIATLERCYNNPAVFTGVVKIRKGEAVRLMIEATAHNKVHAIFSFFTSKIRARIPTNDAHASETREAINNALKLIDHSHRYTTTSLKVPFYLGSIVIASALIWKYREKLPELQAVQRTVQESITHKLSTLYVASTQEAS